MKFKAQLPVELFRQYGHFIGPTLGVCAVSIAWSHYAAVLKAETVEVVLGITVSLIMLWCVIGLILVVRSVKNFANSERVVDVNFNSHFWKTIGAGYERCTGLEKVYVAAIMSIYVVSGISLLISSQSGFASSGRPATLFLFAAVVTLIAFLFSAVYLLVRRGSESENK